MEIEDALMEGALTVDGIPINDRGDGPAQIVIEKNLRAQAQRRADSTKEELTKITDRIDKTMAAFELNEKLLEDNKSAFFVPDLIELEKIIGDAIQKRRYQQQVMIFIVGYEDVSDQRLKTLTQINDFFTHYINNINEKDLEPKIEVDLEDVSSRVQEAMETAAKATDKLTEIKEEMSSYVDKLQGGKLASKGKKKLEKALVQAKDDIMNLTEKLMGAHSEIEDKEDAMTKLYKQLDLKNIEVLKYRNLAEKAKNNTGQAAEDLREQLESKDSVIDDLNRMIADQDLTIKQYESMRDNNSIKLQKALDESEGTIGKLKAKIQILDVLVEDTKTNLFKQQKAEIEDLRQEHLQEIELLKVEYQEKIDAIEQENQIKEWASESEEEESEATFGRKSNLESRRSNKSRKDGKLSRQASTLSLKKSAGSSRHTSALNSRSSAKPASAAGDTMSKSIPDPAKIGVRPRDDPGTPKKMTRTVSNLAPVHEVPFEGNIPIEDEEKWDQVPKEQMPSAFKQYRKESLLIVKGLQSEIQKTKEENHQQVTKLKAKVKEKEEKWDGEKKTLLKQVGTIEKLRQEAEKEADKAVAQLEEFVQDQEKVAKLADVQEKKVLKKLTPEQRAKYMGGFQTNIPSIDEISGDTGNDGSEGKEKTEGDQQQTQVKTAKEEQKTAQKDVKIEEFKPQEDVQEKKPADDAKDDGIDAETSGIGLQTDAVETMARSLQTSRQGSQQSVGDSKIEALKKKLSAAGKMKAFIEETPHVPGDISQSQPHGGKTQPVVKDRHGNGGKTQPVVRDRHGNGGKKQSVVEDHPIHGDDSVATLSLPELRDQAVQVNIKYSPVSHQNKMASIATQTVPSFFTTPSITMDCYDSDSQSIPHKAYRSRRYYSSSSESPISLGGGDSRLHCGMSGEEGDIEDEGESEDRGKGSEGLIAEDLVIASVVSDEDVNAPGFNKERPLSASSQISLAEKYRALLEQKKADIVERRSRATSMHGSLLSAASASGKSSEGYLPEVPFPEEDGHISSKLMSAASHPRDHSSVLLYSRAPSMSNESGVSMHEDDDEEEELLLLPYAPATTSIGCMTYHVDRQDIGLSPVAFSSTSEDSKDSKESKASSQSKKSLSEVADHPIVQDYLKTYGVVNEFKEAFAKMLADKDLMSASEQLADIKDMQFDQEKNVRYQVSQMTVNVQTFMKEASGILNTLLSNDYDASISDLVSRANTSKTRLGVDNLDRELTGITSGSAQSQYPTVTGSDPGAVKQLQDKYDNIQQDLLQQRKDYEERLNENAVVMIEMQDTIQELQREMAALGATPSKLPSTFSRVSSATDSSVDPSIIFSRLDADRNQKALKRGLNSQKVSSEQYNETVKIMDQYTMLPAKRLVHLVKKYTHHAHMKAIEENVRHSSVLDDEVFQILEKMERLQNMRAQRWGEEMDEMAAERTRLSHLLLEALCRIEQESGLFMIKPILSYEGRNQFLQYYNKSSSLYRTPMRTPMRPSTIPLGTPPPDVVPAPTPAQAGPMKSVSRPTTTQFHNEPRIVHVEVPMSDKASAVPVQGSSLNLVGTPPTNMWAMSSSVVNTRSLDSGSSSQKPNSLINTPRILELDINRMLIGQNAVSALTRPFQSNDLLVNASNNSVRSYMTIARPSAQPNLRPNRPSSVGNDSERARTPNNTPFIGGKPASAGSPHRRGSSGFSIHGRAKSEGALAIIPGERLSPPLNANQPLPPIKVPSSGDKGGGDASKNPSRTGSVSGVSVINEETASQGRVSSVGIPDLAKDALLLHPSPPHTPPGSSLHQSPTPPRLPSATSSVGGGGGDPRLKASLRSNSRSTVHSITPERGVDI